MSEIYYVRTFLDRRWVCRLVANDAVLNDYSSYDFVDENKFWQLVRPWRAKDLKDPNIKDSTELNERNTD